MTALENILSDIIGTDENLINDFSATNEAKIKDFFQNLWKEYQMQISLSETAQDVEIATPIAETEPEAETVTENLTENAENTDNTENTENQHKNMLIKFDTNPEYNRENAVHEALAVQIKDKQITFQNGKVNQDYCLDFDIEKLGIPEIAEVYFKGLEGIGLQYLPEEKKIKGVPILAGDHRIEMQFKRKDWVEGKPLISREVVLIVNPDAKSLWKNIPTPKDIEYYKDDSACQFPKISSKDIEGKDVVHKNMVAASQRGRSHALEGKPRDDDFALHFDEETACHIMIVADGAGSANYSRRGSEIACNTSMKICKEKLLSHKDDFIKNSTSENKNEIGKILQDIISHAVFESYKAIEKEAQEKNTLVKDFATTLLVAICRKFDYGWFIAAWWVGDGGIGVYRKDPQYLKVMGEPDGGEFAGQTRFLTMPEIIRNELYSRMKYDVVEDFTALILMTDGITDPKFETDANLKRIEKWHALWDDLNGNNDDKAFIDFSDDELAAGQLLKWLDFWSPGNHDDRTIAILF
ncbi:MAG: protein phosphatase 2C domain-containing protein [Bacteroidales bacterium]|nr:protein phosphatase 2C domain-containing protein [Bacteroidales bacterium]